jgi:uncharacterized protein with GYD domain
VGGAYRQGLSVRPRTARLRVRPTILSTDYLAIGDGLDDNGALAFSLALGSLGNVRTTSVAAFTPEQFAAIVKKLP